MELKVVLIAAGREPWPSDAVPGGQVPFGALQGSRAQNAGHATSQRVPQAGARPISGRCAFSKGGPTCATLSAFYFLWTGGLFLTQSHAGCGLRAACGLRDAIDSSRDPFL